MAPSKAEIESITRSGKRRPWVRSALRSIIVLAAVIAAYWLWSGGLSGGPKHGYVTENSRIADMVVTVTATGTVEPTNKVEVSSELSGTILSVEVDHNDPVSKGQVLARLKTDKLEATVAHGKAVVAARKARVAEAGATLDETRATYDRTVELEQRNVSTVGTLIAARAAFERARAALKSAEADVQVAEADLRVNEANLAQACICSSIDGIVLQRNVEVGQIVASSFQTPVLFTIAEDLREMEIRVDIDEADIGKVRVGNDATFTVEAYQDRSFPAVISELRFMPETVEGVVTYKAVLSIRNEDLLLRPGMTATAEITIEKIDQALVVPNAALRFAPPSPEESETAGGSGLLGLIIRRPPSAEPATRNEAANAGQRTIWLLRNDQAVPVEVRVGSTDGSVTEILAGKLSQGDPVITDMVERR